MLLSVAADSGLDRAVADSVGFLLGSTPAARAAWLNDSSQWSVRLVEPLLTTVRGRLGVTGSLSGSQRAALARRLAARAAVVRWGHDAGEELLVASDDDVRRAVGLFRTTP